ncbi:hypothetical protein [Campylobacter gracilis]|uniref:Uncharacterized protein n=1 Tax=Campylobacter gracilis RM3268 TaxID=553220 RepID=C8PE89_9BACT|nr:hypothetical protein [Campylobacter gracilis]EEV18962.1 hypothetical protein CAMGR0001_2439 [Campylobacter gracilis RM3268]UEB45015.1 hypothetical protein LK410_08405 [Campylobacter gracilis]
MPEFYGYVRKILALVAYFGATARIIHEKRSRVAVGDRNSARMQKRENSRATTPV